MTDIVKTLKELAVIATLILNATEKIQQREESDNKTPHQKETTT